MNIIILCRLKEKLLMQTVDQFECFARFGPLPNLRDRFYHSYDKGVSNWNK